ncbi:MAG: acetyltransferase [Gammaproteobacteria bacterium]|nr:acetyltransferase [Gammaproteobacteria bacterium]
MAKPNKFVLWGSAGHAKVLAEIISLRSGSVLALFDNRQLPSALPGVTVYRGEAGFRSWVETQGDLKGIAGLAAIGGNRGHDRLAIQAFFFGYGLDIPILVHPAAVISSSAYLGAGSQVLAQANVAADARLGKACIINHFASVDHECQIGDGAHIAPGATLCGCVKLADNVFIGAGAIVLPHISIGSNAVIGAGAVVTRNVPAGVTVVGNPAKPLINGK